METRFTPDGLEDVMDTAEVIVPEEETVHRNFAEFIPMIVAIISAVNLIWTNINGQPLFNMADDEIYNVVSGLVMLGTIVWTAWKNTSFSKKDIVRKLIANQVMTKPKFKDMFK